MEFENVNWGMALRYISKYAKSDDQVGEQGFDQWCPVITRKGNCIPGMSGCKVFDEKWTPGIVPSDDKDKKKVLAEVLEFAVVFVY